MQYEPSCIKDQMKSKPEAKDSFDSGIQDH
jgi:hypothetical protein